MGPDGLRLERHLLWIDCSAANLVWVLVCTALAVNFRDVATPFGFAHLLGEAVFVGGLARLEWRHRELLLTAA